MKSLENENQIQAERSESLTGMLTTTLTSTTSTTSSSTTRQQVSAPGELGTPVHINVSSLSVKERIEYDEGWKNHSFNKYASDLISVRRSLPDVRDPL